MKLLKILSLFYTWYRQGGVAYARKIGVNIGENCRIYTKNFGSEPFLITIGNHVTVTRGVEFITHDGSAWLMRDQKGRRYVYKRIEIKDNVFIGVNSIIMPGVIIENNVIVAAGSVLTKSVPEGVIVAGVPARIIGKFESIKTRMLNSYISDEQLVQTLNYKSRVLMVVDNEFKPFLVNNNND